MYFSWEESAIVVTKQAGPRDEFAECWLKDERGLGRA